MTHDYRSLPPDLPAPVDDGAADHLAGLSVPAVRLPSTHGGEVDLARAAAGPGQLVVYVYPRTGTPGEPLPEGWDDIPGARGCTPQSCAFRDHVAEFAALGATLLGVSAQSAADQGAPPGPRPPGGRRRAGAPPRPPGRAGGAAPSPVSCACRRSRRAG